MSTKRCRRHSDNPLTGNLLKILNMNHCWANQSLKRDLRTDRGSLTGNGRRRRHRPRHPHDVLPAAECAAQRAGGRRGDHVDRGGDRGERGRAGTGFGQDARGGRARRDHLHAGGSVLELDGRRRGRLWLLLLDDGGRGRQGLGCSYRGGGHNLGERKNLS